MREIKFRGKHILAREWIYGDLFYKNDKSYIHFYDCNNFECIYEVNSEAIGQHTGLKDKNDKEIYEGDILRSEAYSSKGLWYCFWNNREAEFSVSKIPMSKYCSKYKTNGLGKKYVIGNIYENPELLKEI